MNMPRLVICALACLTIVTPHLRADTAKIVIDAAAEGPKVNPQMYGIFLEEIGHGVDGGLYGELVRNRAFEDGRPPEGYVKRGDRWVDERGFASGFEEYGYEVGGLPFWSLIRREDAGGDMALETTGGVSEASSYCLRLKVDAPGEGLGVANEGYFGIGVADQREYRLSFSARVVAGDAGAGAMPVTVRLEDAQGKACSDEATFELTGDAWQTYEGTLTGARQVPRARLVMLPRGAGEVMLDFVSLFPAETWKGRPNGLRPDIAQLIADLKPGFVRFPGGCVVEGGTIESSYNWKSSVGPLQERREQWGPWHYRETHGVGVLEYLQVCEDLNAEPLWVGFAGQTCIFRERENVPMSEMGWVRDNFLDFLEYANGPADSKWGGLRAAAGRPDPFALRLVEIGNENEGPEYTQRYKYIHDELKAKYPDVVYLADMSYSNQIPSDTYDIADRHFYNSPNWFFTQDGMFDDRDRNLPPLYLGEVAVTSQHGGPLRGNLFAALAEGTYLLGCERNADVVSMVSYAPLLAHVDGRSWGWHGMIYHDSLRAFGTASYYLWKLFGHHRPDVVLAVDADYQPESEWKIAGQIGLGTWDSKAEFKDVKVVSADGQTLYESDFAADAPGWQPAGGRWQVANGVYRQSRRGQGLAYLGDPTWGDYTLTLKARQLEGGEGFLIVFGRREEDRFWWNLGGWGNSQHAIEHNQSAVGRPKRGKIETERWYDVKVEIRGARVRCYLDGELVHEAESEQLERFVAGAGRDKATGDVIVKVINATSKPVASELALKGVGSVKPKATVIVLTAEEFEANNSFNQPQLVAPQTTTIDLPGAEFSHEFPARSLTILRIGAD
jgi:alpha-L-arabinofuranosidase